MSKIGHHENFRRVFFLTGARSEYDLLRPVLRAVLKVPGLRAEVIVGAAHLSPFHGINIDNIRRDGFPIAGTVESLLCSETWKSCFISNLFEGVTRLIASNRPDVMFVAGDREEALAGALAATFRGFRLPACMAETAAPSQNWYEVYDGHLEAFSPSLYCDGKPSTTANSNGRTSRANIGTGGTGLDRLREEQDISDEVFNRQFQIDVREPFFLLIHHPASLINPEDSGSEMGRILEGILSLGHPVFCSYPNFDPGNIAIRRAIDEAKTRSDRLIVFHTLPREPICGALPPL